jgi:lipopolysaccharide transport system ATP-binding protein
MAHIQLKNVSFNYNIYNAASRSLKMALMRNVGGDTKRNDLGVIEVQALRNVSLEIAHGERVGLIGRNGSGKSTLLKLLAGLYFPARGTIEVPGRVVSLMSRAVGIEQELPGRENIELPLRLMGATDAEVAAAKRDLAGFTGLGEFMDFPVRTYSDGMRARLVFGLCTSVAADVLLLEEWLSAGDIDFAHEAEQRLNDMLEKIGIVIVASHNLGLLSRVCSRVIWLERGRVIMDGHPHSVLTAYNEAARDRAEAAAIERDRLAHEAPETAMAGAAI